MLQASCHCGAIRLELARRPRTLTECNCSICRRYGGRWAYSTLKSVRLKCAKGALAQYSYGRGTFLYHRCTHCGCVTHYTRINTARDDRIAINARMIDPDELASIPVRLVDVRRNGKRGMAARQSDRGRDRQRRT